MKDVIQLKKSNILRYEIVTDKGETTGNYLEFDMEDIEMPLKINQCGIEHKKNLEYARNQFIIIDKKEDHKGKYLLSWKEEEKIKIMKEFYKREMDALDLFLGKDGCKKMLNGRKPYYSMYDDINEALQPILPNLKANVQDINSKIRNKYSIKEEDNILE